MWQCSILLLHTALCIFLKNSRPCKVHTLQYVSIVFWALPLYVQVEISPPPNLKVLVSSPQIREELSLHLQPETWTSERLFNESVFAARCHGVQVSSCLLLQICWMLSLLSCLFSCMISIPIIRLAGMWLRLQANAWKTLAYKGSFLRGPLGDVWHLHGSWFAFNLGWVEFSDAGCLLAALLFSFLTQNPVLFSFYFSFSLSLLLAFASSQTIRNTNNDHLHWCWSAEGVLKAFNTNADVW